ncbi:MAG TPA: peptide-methionine (S)-S-oxide reductase MsrA, partial [Deltaproteobacteria bacterium]|nr:peptide-methionine (S)-S-oxide reductase MsrA [Deltaproteobacteria bacterium]
MTKTFMKGMVILMAATTLSGDAQGKGYETATFAGGCFWCMEEAFSAVPGVIEAVPGYTGGETENPTYEEVCSGTTGHLEAVRVVFDPSRVSYRELLDVFWRNVDPTDASGQFADRGPQYKTAIFAHTPEQEDAALKSKAALEATGRFKSPVVTPVLKAVTFYPAEEYHQNYGRKNPSLYRRYRSHSGRNEFLSRVW